MNNRPELIDANGFDKERLEACLLARARASDPTLIQYIAANAPNPEWLREAIGHLTMDADKSLDSRSPDCFFCLAMLCEWNRKGGLDLEQPVEFIRRQLVKIGEALRRNPTFEFYQETIYPAIHALYCALSTIGSPAAIGILEEMARDNEGNEYGFWAQEHLRILRPN